MARRKRPNRFAPVPARPAPKPQYLATFMPWANIGSELQIGPVSFWSYDRYVGKKIKDKAIRKQLDKVLACYIGKDGKAVNSVEMITHGATDFRNLEMSECEEVQRAVDALVFSIIYPNTSDLIRHSIWTDAPPSSDRYQFYMQRFTPGGKYTSVRAGVSTDIWPIKELRFSQPWALGGFRSRPNDDLVRAFGKVLEMGFAEDERRRIMRSLEWFRLAHTQADNVHPLSKVIMMATAFETLLQVGRVREKAKDIRTKVETKYRYRDALTDVREELSPPIKGAVRVKVPVTLTMAAWWAQDFYDMRSDITHGDFIDPERMRFTLPGGKVKLSQLDVATVVFGEMLVWELEERKLCGSKVDDLMGSIRGLTRKDEIGPLEWKEWASGVRAQHKLVDVHRALGWCKPRPIARQKVRRDDSQE